VARTVTLESLRERARLYSDQRVGASTPFISDAELDILINNEIGIFYDELVATFGHEYFMTESTVAIVANTARYVLPADFLQLVGVQILWGSDRDEQVPAYHAHRFSKDAQVVDWSEGSVKAYRLWAGTHIEFIPVPSRAITGRLIYIPTFPVLTASGGGGS
jgi:hypothetical protein